MNTLLPVGLNYFYMNIDSRIDNLVKGKNNISDLFGDQSGKSFKNIY